MFIINLYFLLSAAEGSQPEALNKKAISIITRVRDKLTGLFLTTNDIVHYIFLYSDIPVYITG